MEVSTKRTMSVFGSSVLAMVMATGVAAAEPDRIDDTPNPTKVPQQDWTPTQQWRAFDAMAIQGGMFARLVFADEMGSKLTELGRGSLITEFFRNSTAKDATSAVLWALAGADAKALDLKKAAAELTAANIYERDAESILDDLTEAKANALKVGAAVEAAAADDPGVAAILKVAETAKAEWATYAGKNAAAYERYLALKDGVRTGKTNHKSFAGCWDATQPAFATLVKATKFPWEVSGDYLPAYVNAMVSSPETYVTTAAFAACAWSVDPAGEALAAGALNADRVGGIQVGPRTITLTKLMAPALKPKFADRELSQKWENGMRSRFQNDGRYLMPSINDIMKMMTPLQGALATVKADGDVTNIAFKGSTVDACLQWVSSNKVSSVSASGDVQYEKKCKKRGKVEEQADPTEVATKFAGGFKPGVSVLLVNKFPVTAWQGKKFVAVLGVPVK